MVKVMLCYMYFTTKKRGRGEKYWQLTWEIAWALAVPQPIKIPALALTSCVALGESLLNPSASISFYIGIDNG